MTLWRLDVGVRDFIIREQQHKNRRSLYASR